MKTNISISTEYKLKYVDLSADQIRYFCHHYIFNILYALLFRYPTKY